ncbi:MAG: hypothetical protein ABI691_11055 [Ginsengibacter sp.]
MRQGNLLLIRYSIQAFNSQDDFNQLYIALTEIVFEGGLIST